MRPRAISGGAARFRDEILLTHMLWLQGICGHRFGGTTMPSSGGWCPFAIQKPVPRHKFWVGNRGRDAVVMHISKGTLQSMISWFRGGSAASAHFGIGK